MSELGAAIGRFRRLAGLTQAQLADAAGLSVGLVRDLEQGRTQSPRWDSVEALACALGLGAKARADLGMVLDRRISARRLHDGRGPEPHPRPAKPVVAVRILGPVTVERRGSVIDVGPARRRAVLALIALRGTSGVRPGELTELIWPKRLPSSAADMVHRSISQLRQLLADGSRQQNAGQAIVWTGVSYRLQIGSSCRLDSADFRDLTVRGDSCAAGGEPDRACLFYEQALGLWRGGAVADIDCLQQHPAVIALRRQRCEVIRRYARAAALAGDDGRAIEELFAACQAEPLNEVLHAIYIKALSSTGQRAEAVDVFDRLRARLGEELGIGPSEQVWRAYRLMIEA